MFTLNVLSLLCHFVFLIGSQHYGRAAAEDYETPDAAALPSPPYLAWRPMPGRAAAEDSETPDAPAPPPYQGWKPLRGRAAAEDSETPDHTPYQGGQPVPDRRAALDPAVGAEEME